MNDSEKPSYMNLGAPRDRDTEDVFSHEVNMSRYSENREDNLKSFAKKVKEKKPSLNFKMVKTDVYSMSSPFGIVKWIAVAALLGVSVASFLTQSVLFVYDKIANKDVVETPIVESRALGSDDNNGTSTLRLPEYRIANPESFPKLTTSAYLAADIKSGEVIRVSNETNTYPLASVSKLMTALVAIENMDMQKIAIVSRDSYNTYGAQGGLLLGEKIKLSDLMYPLLMESSNDAAEVIADTYGHTEFLALMNKKAKDLGMFDTYYEDPSGLSPKNTSSVDDQFILLKYIYDNHYSDVFDKTRVRQYEILRHKWYNKNRLLNQDTFIGGKNGYIDESKWTTASIFDIPLQRGGKRPIAVVLLKSLDREGDTLKIINFLKKNAYFAE